jgi:hypothetical protein
MQGLFGATIIPPPLAIGSHSPGLRTRHRRRVLLGSLLPAEDDLIAERNQQGLALALCDAL